MKIRYVSDDHVVICLDGIRTITKIDNQPWSSNPESFDLQVAYRGEIKTFYYHKDKNKRDAMYDSLKNTLTDLEIKVTTDPGVSVHG